MSASDYEAQDENEYAADADSELSSEGEGIEDNESIGNDVEDLQPAELIPLPDSVNIEEIESEDTELILFQIPRHEKLKAALKGSKFVLPQDEKDINAKLGTLQGQYVFRDRGKEITKNLRAVFVALDKEGLPTLQLGKCFSRFVTVAYEKETKRPQQKISKPRKYPSPGKELKLKYHPIGKIIPSTASK